MRPARSLATGLGAVLVGLVGLAAIARPAAEALTAAGNGPPAPSEADLRRVGPLFAGSPGGRHFCTASVVAAPSHDLILTAAHCMAGTGEGLYFAPGYQAGVAPFGYWKVTAAYVQLAWRGSAAPEADYAFLRVVPAGGGAAAPIQDVVGGETLATSSAGGRVWVAGYPAGIGGGPVTCAPRTYERTGFPAFRCHGFSDGTSGGPWLADSGASGASGIVGLVGGLEQGGCSSSVSYSPRLGAAAVLLARAAAGGPADVVPAAPGDGCTP